MTDSYDQFPQPMSAPADTSLPDPTIGSVESIPNEPAIDEPDDGAGFAALGLRPELLKALADLGYEEPTPIQRETIPPLIAGHDLLGQAATGTGKTAAFALPALQRIDTSRRAEPSVLVLVPTRELAVQVSEAMFKYGKELGIKVVPVFGGQPIQRQLQLLDRGVHVVVATPGRAIDHIGRGSLKLDGIRTVILDEADEMLDMGFTDDIESILESTPDDRQTVLFSATLPHRINAIAKRYQRDPVKIKIGRSRGRVGRQGPRPPDRVLGAAGAQGARARSHPRHRGTAVGARVLPHAHRGRPAHRDDERARLPRRGVARRHGPDPARPRDGPPPRRHGRTPRRHRRRGARPRRRHPHPRRQLRRAVGRRELRAPHRSRRTGRARRHGDHARRAARASPTGEHRAADEADDHRGQGAVGRRPALAPDRADRRAGPRVARLTRPRGLQLDPPRPRRRGQRPQHRARRDQARARRTRRAARRAGDPRRLRTVPERRRKEERPQAVRRQAVRPQEGRQVRQERQARSPRRAMATRSSCT